MDASQFATGAILYQRVTIRGLLYAKEMTFRKGWLDFSLLNLTRGVAWTDSENDVGGAGACSSKGESMMTAAEAGTEDTSSDGYRRSDKEGSG